MVFDQVFQRFLDESPVCVMMRATMESIFAPAKLDALFHRVAVEQYERELLFSTVVDLTSLVVCRIARSVNAAYVKLCERIPVSIKSVYDKLAHVEPSTARALVQHTAREVSELIDRMGGACTPLLPGFRVRILDGNHINGTEHRLGVLRGTAAGALPGQSLVLLDPQRMVIDDCFPCEDGHAQERSLLHQVLGVIRARDLIIDDRNFCTLGFLCGIHRRKGRFITRQHAGLPWQPQGRERFVGRCKSGEVYEQGAVLTDPETGRQVQVRRIRLKLKKPTRDGDGEIFLLTDLPASKANAVKVAQLYLHRWKLETAFQQLTVHLRCEPNTLGYPRAALFAFAVAMCCYNLLAAVKAALRSHHGEKTIEQDVSSYYVTEEISAVYRGMMIALPPEQWKEFQTMRPAQLAARLRRWAGGVDLKDYPKHVRGPKKPRPKRPNAKSQHVSTAKCLAEQRVKTRRERKKTIGISP